MRARAAPAARPAAAGARRARARARARGRAAGAGGARAGGDAGARRRAGGGAGEDGPRQRDWHRRWLLWRQSRRGRSPAPAPSRGGGGGGGGGNSHRAVAAEAEKRLASWLPFGLGGEREAEGQGERDAASGGDNPVYAPGAETIPPDQLPFQPCTLLRGTFLEGRQLALAYKATRDGWGAREFHERCDLSGPCVVIGRTSSGRRFGAFSPIAWMSSDDYREKADDFLFAWPAGSAGDAQPQRVLKIGGPGPLFDWARGGPQWGAEALAVGPPASPAGGGIAGPGAEDTGWGDLRTARSRLGRDYALSPDGEASLFGEPTAELVEFEVYYSPELKLMYD